MTPKTIQKYLQFFNIYVDKDETKFLLSCYPYFLNIYGVKTFFEKNGLPSDCIRLEDKRDLIYIEKPFIAVTKNGIIPIVKQKKNSMLALVDGRKKKFDLAFFEEQFSGIVLVHEKKPVKSIHFGLNNAFLFILFAFLLALILGSLLGKNSRDFFVILNVSIGFVSSFLLVLKSVGSLRSRFVDRVCSISKGKDCSDVINSPASKLFNRYSLAEIGVSFFGCYLFSLLFDLNMSNCFILLNYVALLFVPWSLWYQISVVKGFCTLCLCVLLSLITTAVIAFPYVPELSMEYINPLSFLSFIESGSLFILVLFIANKLIKQIEFQRNISEKLIQYNPVKFSMEIFNYLLEQTDSLKNDLSHVGLAVGKHNPLFSMLIVTNPFCSPCAHFHSLIKKDIGSSMIIRYIFVNTQKEYDWFFRLLIAAKLCFDEKTFLKTIDEWYEWGVNDPELFKIEHREIFNQINDQSVFEERDKHIDFVIQNEINSTPSVWINSKKIPNGYDFRDLTFISKGIV